jgi:hypothetical protein
VLETSPLVAPASRPVLDSDLDLDRRRRVHPYDRQAMPEYDPNKTNAGKATSSEGSGLFVRSRVKCVSPEQAA